MKKRDSPQVYRTISIFLLPVLLLAGAALLSTGLHAAIHGYMTRLDGAATALLGLQPRDYAAACLALFAFASVITVLVVAIRTLLDRVPPPFKNDEETDAQGSSP